MHEQRPAVIVERLGLALVVALLLPAGIAGADDETGARAFTLPAHGAIRLVVPALWRADVHQPPGVLPPTIEFAPPEGDAFSVLITPIWKANPAAEDSSLERIRALVEQSVTHVRGTAVEKEIAVLPIEGPELSGFLFSVTDRTVREGSTKAGDYRYMTQGMGLLGDLTVTFTIFTHRAEEPARDQALEMLKGARRVAATDLPPPPAGSSLRKLTYPGKPWSLVLDLPGFEFEKRETRSDQSGVMVMGSNRETGIIISVFLEKAAKSGDAVACREYYWKKGAKSPLKKKDVRLTERSGMALVEYLVPLEANVDQKHVNAYMSHDGVWVDIHISKPIFTAADWPLFENILSSATIAD